MCDQQHGMVRLAAGPVYKPLSLDFVTRPNPVEPQSVPQRHPLNGTPQLAKTHSSRLPRILLDSGGNDTVERPTKRRKSGEGKSLDLPKLPVRQGTKRLRIPPTLSGLHQPPPNAGLLPSISTEQPVRTAEPAVAEHLVTGEKPLPPGSGVDSRLEDTDRATETSKPKRNRWSDEETACLLKGVARFGIGNWTKILKCSDYSFKDRTALDLKDRFRICCPEEYLRTQESRSSAHALVRAEDERTSDKSGAASKSGKTGRKSRVELQKLGINQPFEKNKRRKRHGYSAEEDEAILKGFGKYGNAWATIRADYELCLEHRTATDLRDRMRTKYPEEYAKAGLTPRPDVFPKPPKRGKDHDSNITHESSKLNARTPVEAQSTVAVPAPEKESNTDPKQSSTKRPHQPPLLPYDSVFWGAPFDDDDLVDERVTLDRGILDWPGDGCRQSTLDYDKRSGNDSLVSLRLPEPTAATFFYPLSYGLPSSVLPSVAAITAVPPSDMDDQLELPSLMIGALENDGRAGGHFLGFDELLS